MNKISTVRDFWNETPCDGKANYAERSGFRYRKERWLVPILERIATQHENILEVGCGQGTDGITLCKMLRPGRHYTGVDISEASLSRAHAAAAESINDLQVTPVFQVENAEQLSFPADSFDCVLSVGALHHTDSTERAIAEVKRVLSPKGSAFIFLYRTVSPKLLGAHALRSLQRCMDAVFRTDRIIYQALRAWDVNDTLGTAFYECFGVPILQSYTRQGMMTLFRDFSAVSLSSHGPAFLTRGPSQLKKQMRSDALGYLWLAEVRK